MSGIVTSADLAGGFGTVARPFFTLVEIERRSRRCLGRVHSETDVQKVHKKHFNAPSLRSEQLDLLDRFVGMLRLYDPDHGATTGV
ncbi:hypothetical protein [Streptomyces sp. TRM68367]|uniref:hypothetical protein n=1 Tax=Streptomyces sp. TRM68367 TaxID=2758415 RepID=UPI00165A33A9|nr:hypothetical protein [Streptomyces sp. TRM68367]MBC9726271.1 hypothetical protein [Streptomyces sp. TRM68367]